MIPRSGKIHVSNAALTSAGRAIQMMKRPNLGKIPAKSANRQPILFLLSLASWSLDPRADRRNRHHSRGMVVIDPALELDRLWLPTRRNRRAPLAVWGA